MATMTPTLICFIVVLALGNCQPNVLCPVINQTQCSCAGTVMSCSDRSLTTLPVFTSDKHIVELHLENNRIENITQNAFKNLQLLSRLFLNNNSISRFDPNALMGIEKSLTELILADNQLEQFPTAIGNLEMIGNIDVSNNPINQDNFDETTMYNIGDSLTKFTFGSEDVSAWPSTLRHLQALQSLHVTGGSFFTLPPDAFHGFEGTLFTLSIENTKLIAIPLAMSNLRFLDTLYFNHNHDVGDSGVLIPSFGNRELLTNLRMISLVDDNLTVFPSLLHYLRNVKTLVLDSNRLAFVSDTSVQVAVGTKIEDLSLRNCSLSRVPGALSKLTNITKLDLAENNIHSFENNDFDGMNQLTNLTITKNPLEYIANETFKDLQELRYLNLKDTKINSMPEAIMFLKKLQHLEVPANSIECTCNIVWLKQFMEHCNVGLQIDGSCETIISPINEFLRVHIPHCPNYTNSTQCV